MTIICGSIVIAVCFLPTANLAFKTLLPSLSSGNAVGRYIIPTLISTITSVGTGVAFPYYFKRHKLQIIEQKNQEIPIERIRERLAASLNKVQELESLSVMKEILGLFVLEKYLEISKAQTNTPSRLPLLSSIVSLITAVVYLILRLQSLQ
jgi:hypothetical protein